MTKRRMLHVTGRIMDKCGRWFSRWVPNPAQLLHEKGQTLWDVNCDCSKCLDRRQRYADLEQESFFQQLVAAMIQAEKAKTLTSPKGVVKLWE